MSWVLSVVEFVGKRIGPLLGHAAITRGKRLVTTTPENKAFSDALRTAVASAIAELALPDPERLQAALDRGNAADLLVEVIRYPNGQASVDDLRKEIEHSGYTIHPEQFDTASFVARIQERFLAELPKYDAARSAHSSARAEQTVGVVRDTHDAVLEIRSRLSYMPDIPGPAPEEEMSGALRAVGITYEDARKHIRSADLEAGSYVLDSALGTLEGLSDLATHADARALKQRILLSKAQIAIRSDDHQAARRFLEAARAQGPFGGSRRDIAGWVLLNLGHSEEAHAVLTEEFNGSTDWAKIRAIAALAVGDYDDFILMFGSEGALSDANLLAAVVQYHAGRAKFRAAAAAAEKIFTLPLSDEGDELAAVSAGVSLIASYVQAEDPESVDIAAIIGRTRAQLELSQHAGTAWVRRLFLTLRVQFHFLLHERAEAETAFTQLRELNASAAARLLTNIPGLGSDDDYAKLAPLCQPGAPGSALIAAHAELSKGNASEAMSIVREALRHAESNERDSLLVAQLELRRQAGDNVPSLLEATADISSPSVQVSERVALRVSVGDVSAALNELNDALIAHPRNVHLLHFATDFTLQVLHKGEAHDHPAAGRLARSASDGLVARLDCPENRLLQARVRLATGAGEEAYTMIRAVEEAGYVTLATAGLIADITRELGHVRDHALAARRFHQEYGRTPTTALAAANASVVAGEYVVAQQLYGEAADSNDPNIAVVAYINWARTADAAARAQGMTSTDAGVAILQQGYERLGAPQLASALLLRTLNTPQQSAAAEIVGRDFESAAALPGWKMVGVEELIDLQQKSAHALEAAEKYWRLGALPFETVSKIVGRSGPYTWAALHESPAYVISEPPPLLPRDLRKLIADNTTSAREGRRNLMIDETALLTLEAIGLLDKILQAPSLRTTLFVEAETYSRLRSASLDAAVPSDGQIREQALRVASVAEIATPIELDPQGESAAPTQGEPSLFATRDAGVAEPSDRSQERRPLVVAGAYEESDESPRDEIAPTEVAFALFDMGVVTLQELASARDADPSLIAERRPAGGAAVDTRRPLVIDAATLTTWNRLGLLDALSRWPGGLLMKRTDRAFVLAQAHARQLEQKASEVAISLFRKVTEALEAGAIRLVHTPAQVARRRELGDKEEDGNTAEDREQAAGTADQDDPERRQLGISLIYRVIERRLATANSVEATLWSDDAAVHLALEGGPYMSDALEIALATEALQRMFTIPVLGTAEMLSDLASAGAVSDTDLQMARRELWRARHWFVPDVDGMVAAVLSDAGSHEPDTVLKHVESALQHLPAEAAFRSAPAIADALVRGFIALSERDLQSEQRSQAAGRLLETFRPWLASNVVAAAVTTAFWRLLAVRMVGHSPDEVAAVVRLVCGAITTQWQATRSLAEAVPVVIDTIVDDSVAGPAAGVNRALFLGVHRAIADSSRPDGRPWLPTRIVRLAGMALGIVIEGETHHLGSVATAEGMLPVTYVVRDHDAIDVALGRIETWLQAPRDADGQPPRLAELGKFFTDIDVEVVAEEPDRPSQRFRSTVDPISTLLVAAPVQGEIIALVIAEQFEEDGAPELAELTRSLLLSAEPSGKSDQEWVFAVTEYARRLLQAPRTWIFDDPVQCIRRLHDTALEDVEAMFGSAPPWLAGDNAIAYAKRVSSAADVGDGVRRLLQLLLAWGSREILSIADVRRRLVIESADTALAGGPCGEGATAPECSEGAARDLSSASPEGLSHSEAAEGTNGNGDAVAASELVAHALGAADPYDRIACLLAVLLMLTADSALRTKLFTGSALQRIPDAWQELSSVPLGELASTVLARTLLSPANRTAEALSSSAADVRSTAELAANERWKQVVTDAIREQEPFDKLHSEVVRSVFRAVFTRGKLQSAYVRAQPPACVDGAEHTDADKEERRGAEDPDGGVLAACVALVSLVFAGAVNVVGAGQNIDVLTEEFVRLGSTREFSDALVRNAELLQPMVIGVDPSSADPYRASLLIGLRRLADATSGAEYPSWANPEVLHALGELARRSPSDAERHLAELAAAADHEDRFLSPLRDPVPVQSAALLDVLRGVRRPER